MAVEVITLRKRPRWARVAYAVRQYRLCRRLGVSVRASLAMALVMFR